MAFQIVSSSPSHKVSFQFYLQDLQSGPATAPTYPFLENPFLGLSGTRFVSSKTHALFIAHAFECAALFFNQITLSLPTNPYTLFMCQ